MWWDKSCLWRVLIIDSAPCLWVLLRPAKLQLWWTVILIQYYCSFRTKLHILKLISSLFKQEDISKTLSNWPYYCAFFCYSVNTCSQLFQTQYVHKVQIEYMFVAVAVSSWWKMWLGKSLSLRNSCVISVSVWFWVLLMANKQCYIKF